MGEHGKQLLKQHIKHKRVSEGLAEIPDDLFAKRPRYEMTREEQARQEDRRQKNKEAAEKSRRKKKDEFLNLQTENDQLQQDKCQLVSMIEELKASMNKVTKDNKGLRYNIDHLKRWIGKHAADLGLGKHVQKKQNGEKRSLARAMDSSSSDGVLRGNPSLYSAGIAANEDEDQLPGPTSSPLSSRFSPSPPVSASPSAFPISKPPVISASPASPPEVSEYLSPQRPTQDLFQPVGIRTVVSLPQLPGPLVVEKPQEDLADSETGQQQEVMHDGGQKLVYLSKDTVFIVPGENGRQVMVVNPEVQQKTPLDVPEGHQIIATQCVPQISLEGSEVHTTSMEASEASSETPEVNVKTPEAQEANEEAIEANLEATQTAMRAAEMQTMSGDNSDKQAARGESAQETTKAIGDIDSTAPEVSTMHPPSVASSIDCLLKLGCTIQLPAGIEVVQDATTTPLSVVHDH